MRISVTINLDDGETFDETAEEVAVATLDALGADPAVNTCWVTINQPPTTGSAGADPGALPA